MIYPHGRTNAHAFGVDDVERSSLLAVPNPVSSGGHSKRALVGHFCRAPKTAGSGSFTQIWA
ncbi:MAG TPA: hypothetical protein VEU96_31865, partial [Bryobacteraceae bacterium]|nr:hypothetical protein [Bryobacteraceae bacterium]